MSLPLTFIAPLLAEIPDAAPAAATWSDKEVIWLVFKIVGGVAAALVTLAPFAYRLAVRSYRADARRWKEVAEKRGEQLDELKKGSTAAVPPDLGAKLAEVQADLLQAEHEAEQLTAQAAQAKDAEATQKLLAHKLQADLASL